MLVPLSWLRDFAPFDMDAKALGEVLDDLGMVVEGIRAVGKGLDGVVTARVVEIAPIAGADKIRRVLVDAGGADPVQVVCGAWNFKEGDLVPLATVGAVLPGEFEITRRKMKGVLSDGMLCSPTELGLGEDGAGILVLSSDPGSDSGVGTPLMAALGITPDVVYDLAIEGNRPDAMSIAGVARDAAARLGLPFSLPDVPPPTGTGPSPVSIRVDDPALCPRFTAQVLDQVSIQTSPDWVGSRLTLAGMRPINSVVDASNYVMLELGQPTHPYDLDLLPGTGFIVRAARAGETLETLDGVTRTLGQGAYPDCVICDAEDQVVGVAGVMGGVSSEISSSTRRVVLEAANFTPMAIARTSKRLGVRSEASARFERGVDVDGIERAVARFCSLVSQSSPDAVVHGAFLDVRTAPTSRPAIRVRTDRVNTILGTALSDEDVRSYLAPIGFSALVAAEGVHDVTPPSFRPDAVREIDVIEEVARHHGYANIARTVPHSPNVGKLTPYQRERRRVREILAGAGFSEAVGAQLLGPGDHARAGLAEDGITAVDPLVREESVLRTSLLPGMLRTVAFNTDRRYGDLGMFEIGHVFRRPVGPGAADAELPDERELLGIVLAGEGVDGTGSGARGAVVALWRVIEALHLEGIELVPATRPGMHPGRTASVTIDRSVLGYAGEVDPEVSEAWGISGRVGWAEVDLELLLGARRVSELARPVSRFPSSDIDLAFAVAEGTAAGDVRATIRAAAGDLLEQLTLFDVYRGPGVPNGQRSLAFRLRLCAVDRTLTDPEIAAVRERCIAAVEGAYPARLRA